MRCNDKVMINIPPKELVFSLLFLTVLNIQTPLRAQNPDNDVVALKNGTYLRGRVVELIPEQALRFRLATGDTLEIRMDSVKSLTKDDSPVKVKMNDLQELRKWGYVFTPEVFAGMGQSQGWSSGFGNVKQGEFCVMLAVVNGIRLGPLFEVGVGVGLDIWDERMFIPLFFDFRMNFLKKDNTPFLYLNPGYSWGWVNGETGVDLGGVLASGGLGARFMIGKKQRMFLSLGYKYQQYKTKKFMGTNDFHGHFINLGVGVEL